MNFSIQFLSNLLYCLSVAIISSDFSFNSPVFCCNSLTICAEELENWCKIPDCLQSIPSVSRTTGKKKLRMLWCQKRWRAIMPTQYIQRERQPSILFKPSLCGWNSFTTLSSERSTPCPLLCTTTVNPSSYCSLFIHLSGSFAVRSLVPDIFSPIFLSCTTNSTHCQRYAVHHVIIREHI